MSIRPDPDRQHRLGCLIKLLLFSKCINLSLFPRVLSMFLEVPTCTKKTFFQTFLRVKKFADCVTLISNVHTVC
jgi:hypothetical protein